MSNYVPLTLEKVAEIEDGILGLIVKRALLAAARDCVDRPRDKTTRKVVVTLGFKPIPDDDGRLKHIAFIPDVQTRIPKYTPMPMLIKATNAGFHYHPDEVSGQSADEQA